MWLRSCSSLLLLAAACLAQTDLNGVLGQYQAQLQSGQPTPEQIVRNLGNLSNGLRNGNWANPTDRMQATQGALGYLNLLRGNKQFAGDRGVGLGMSGLYRQLGGLQYGGGYGGWVDPLGAWASFRTSYLILNQLQNRFPQDQQIRNDLGVARRAVEVIETKIPDLPKLDWSALDGTAQQEYDELMQRYISVSATVSSAEVTAETMKRSMADQGLALRPEVVSGLTRMKLKLEDSRRLIEQKRFVPARERLDSTEAEAKKILRAFGA